MSTGIEVRTVDSHGTSRVQKAVTGYTVEEESTPVDPADATGATGRFTIPKFKGASSAVEVKRLNRAEINLTDTGLGVTKGTVRTPSSSGGNVALTADLYTTLLAVNRQAQPFQGTAAAYFAYLLSLVDITTDFVADSSFTAVNVVYPGWYGDVWINMKVFAASLSAEVTYASNKIVLRPLRGRVAVEKRDSQVAWAMDDTNLALSVEGYWYESTYSASGLAYPKGGWNEDVQVYQVDAGETVVFDVPIDVSMTSVVQPVAQDYVDRNYTAGSVYCVMGSDGLPVTAAQWNAGGGKVTVEIGEDTRSLIITIIGANNSDSAPFRIAATAGPSNPYSSLRILAAGVFFEKKYLQLFNSVDAEFTSREIGATVDSVFYTSEGALRDGLRWSLSRVSTARHTLSISTSGINRAGETGSYDYPKISAANDYSTAQGWTTIAALNAAAPGLGWSTIADFNAWWAATVADTFANQAFGNIAGARTFRSDLGLWFRIRTANIQPDGISYTAENDTTAQDFNTYAAQMGWTTIADFDASAWAGRTFFDFNAAPLIKEGI